MEEYWDLYSAARAPLGAVIRRGEPHPKGTYHIVVSVWVLNDAGQLLLTQRDYQKEQFPGMWEMQGGAVRQGEESLAAVCRELWEETGIRAEREAFVHLNTLLEATAMVDIYALRWDGDIDQIRLHPGDTINARFATLDMLDEMIRQGILSAAAIRRFGCVREALIKAGVKVGD